MIDLFADVFMDALNLKQMIWDSIRVQREAGKKVLSIHMSKKVFGILTAQDNHVDPYCTYVNHRLVMMFGLEIKQSEDKSLALEVMETPLSHKVNEFQKQYEIRHGMPPE